MYGMIIQYYSPLCVKTDKCASSTSSIYNAKKTKTYPFSQFLSLTHRILVLVIVSVLQSV